MRAFSRSTARGVVVALVAGVLASVVGPTAPAGAYPTSTVRFEGHGWGHGRGLGQYGSLGYAVDESQTYSQIIDHYYGGTTKGVQADGPMTVRLTELDGVDMIVRSDSAFTVAGTAITAGTAALVHRTATGFDLSTAAGCGGPWTVASSLPADAPVVASTDYVGNEVVKMLNECGPTGNVRTYRGTLSMVVSGTTTRVVDTLPMEQYLRGVVPRESPASWGDLGGGKGIEALKAQSVAARSYAQASAQPVCDTTACQVYGGAGLNGVAIEDKRSDAAILATAGEIRLGSNGAVARTEFSSSTGGWTAGGTFPAVEDTGDDVTSNPNHNWVMNIAVSAVEAAYPVGTLKTMSVSKRNGLGADGGRATEVKIVGSTASVTATANDVRSKLGLKSDWYTVVDIPVDVSRLQGSDRVATSIAVSADAFPSGTAKAAVIVSAVNFPDALVGVPLASARSGPILLSNADALSSATLAELARATGPPTGGGTTTTTTAPTSTSTSLLPTTTTTPTTTTGPGQPPGNVTVYLLGGTAALSPNIETQLTNAGYKVMRYGGATRYATAVLVADALGSPSTVLEATGVDFPDALAAGAAAAKVKGAVLLTQGPKMSPETAAYTGAHPGTRYAIGGAAATADPGATSVSGVDRYDTAVKVAGKFFFQPPVAGLASGVKFPDALSGGLHAVTKGGPLLLTPTSTLSAVTAQYIRDRVPDLGTVYAYGGPAAINESVLIDLRTS